MYVQEGFLVNQMANDIHVVRRDGKDIQVALALCCEDKDSACSFAQIKAQ